MDCEWSIDAKPNPITFIKIQINIITMMKLKKTMSYALVTSVLAFTASSCDNEENDDDMVTPAEVSTTYDLGTKDMAGISGTAKFIKNVDNSTTIELAIDGTPADGMHPAHIHFNTALEGGAIALDLGVVNGETGEARLENVTELDNGTDITYEEFLEYDGYINVHLSAEMLGTIVAQGDIGQNDLTGESKIYALDTKDQVGVSGTAQFEERVSGDALATLTLVGGPDNGVHPTHIHDNDRETGGPIAFTFNPLVGGVTQTNVSELDNGSSFSYDDVLGFDGYINVHLDSTQAGLGTILAQGNIGSNE